MKKSTTNMLLLGGIGVGVVLLLRKAKEVAPGPAGPALTGLAGPHGGRGGGGHRGGHHGGGHHGGGHHGGHGHGRGGYAAPGWGPGPGWYGGGGETVYVVDQAPCIDPRTGALMPREFCDRWR